MHRAVVIAGAASLPSLDVETTVSQGVQGCCQPTRDSTKALRFIHSAYGNCAERASHITLYSNWQRALLCVYSLKCSRKELLRCIIVTCLVLPRSAAA